MEFKSADPAKRKQAGVLVVPFWKGKKHAQCAVKAEKWHSIAHGPVHAGDFSGKEGEVLILYNESLPEKRVALIGLGEHEKLTVEKLRRTYATLAKACRSRKITAANIFLPESASLDETDLVRGIAEGLLLANYVFNKHKSKPIKEEPGVLLKQIFLLGASPKGIAAANKYAAIAEGVYYTRDIVNDNADTVTPQYLAKAAKELAKLPHVKTTVFDKRRIQKEKMGFLLAVGQGSTHDPSFIIIEYKGNPKSKDNTVLIGKGITYDTGGLHLKPLNGMDTMRGDMGGAGVVLGTIRTAAQMGLKVNITGVIPAAENAIDAASYKPGDVYTGYAGKSVEITSTDAEGRLVLADALAYAVEHLKPTRIIDFATLTGGIDVAIGAEASGLMSNNDALAEELYEAGQITFERVWRMPLYEEYRDTLKSDVADMRNTGGRSGSPCIAATFLKEFVGDTPWAHLDIASTAFLSDHRRYHPKYATGVGVRLMLEYLGAIKQ